MKLNLQQKAAVEQPYKLNLRIIAGPGTGKTTVLTARFLYFLQQKWMSPWQILVLTFTRKATQNFQQRIEQQFRAFKRLNIFTYHSFCLQILQYEKKHLPQFQAKQQFNVLDETDQKTLYRKFLKTLLEAEQISYDATLLANAIAALKMIKRHNLTTEVDYQTFLTTQQTDLDPAPAFQSLLWKVYCAYENYKTTHNFLDFDDLLIVTYQLLSTNLAVLQRWRKRFKTILIDEFQDTSALQYKLITLLSGKGRILPVTIVGDPDQTIYSWRNAQIKFILEFDRAFPNVKTVYLTTNYRSHQKIVDVANFVIAQNKQRLPNKLQAFCLIKNPPALEIAHFFNRTEQAEKLAATVYDLYKKQHVPLDKIAILYRANWLSAFLESALVKHQLPYYVYKGMKFFARKEIKDLLTLLNAVSNKDDFFIAEICLWIPFFGNKTLQKLQTAAEQAQLSLWDYLCQNLQTQPFLARFESAFKTLIKHFTTWTQQFQSLQPLAAIFTTVLQDYYYAHLDKLIDAHLRKANIKILLEMVANYRGNASNQTGIELLQQFLLETKIYLADGMEATQNRVQLMTIHNTKGLEFDHVFLFDVSPGVFPSARSEDAEEERRLFFVALTRARKSIAITTKQGFPPSHFVAELETLPPQLVKSYDG